VRPTWWLGECNNKFGFFSASLTEPQEGGEDGESVPEAAAVHVVHKFDEAPSVRSLAQQYKKIAQITSVTAKYVSLCPKSPRSHSNAVSFCHHVLSLLCALFFLIFVHLTSPHLTSPHLTQLCMCVYECNYIYIYNIFCVYVCVLQLSLSLSIFLHWCGRPSSAAEFAVSPAASASGSTGGQSVRNAASQFVKLAEESKKVTSSSSAGDSSAVKKSTSVVAICGPSVRSVASTFVQLAEKSKATRTTTGSGSVAADVGGAADVLQNRRRFFESTVEREKRRQEEEESIRSMLRERTERSRMAKRKTTGSRVGRSVVAGVVHSSATEEPTSDGESTGVESHSTATTASEQVASSQSDVAHSTLVAAEHEQEHDEELEHDEEHLHRAAEQREHGQQREAETEKQHRAEESPERQVRELRTPQDPRKEGAPEEGESAASCALAEAEVSEAPAAGERAEVSANAEAYPLAKVKTASRGKKHHHRRTSGSGKRHRHGKSKRKGAQSKKNRSSGGKRQAAKSARSPSKESASHADSPVTDAEAEKRDYSPCASDDDGQADEARMGSAAERLQHEHPHHQLEHAQEQASDGSDAQEGQLEGGLGSEEEGSGSGSDSGSEIDMEAMTLGIIATTEGGDQIEGKVFGSISGDEEDSSDSESSSSASKHAESSHYFAPGSHREWSEPEEANTSEAESTLAANGSASASACVSLPKSTSFAPVDEGTPEMAKAPSTAQRRPIRKSLIRVISKKFVPRFNNSSNNNVTHSHSPNEPAERSVEDYTEVATSAQSASHTQGKTKPMYVVYLAVVCVCECVCVCMYVCVCM
jgi:hypothetical protein